MSDPSQRLSSGYDWRTMVSMAIWGVTGTNGLTGTSKDHEARIKKLEMFQSEIQTVRDIARWCLLGLSAVIGWLLTDPVAKIVAVFLR